MDEGKKRGKMKRRKRKEGERWGRKGKRKEAEKERVSGGKPASCTTSRWVSSSVPVPGLSGEAKK